MRPLCPQCAVDDAGAQYGLCETLAFYRFGPSEDWCASYLSPDPEALQGDRRYRAFRIDDDGREFFAQVGSRPVRLRRPV
jgi:hypothetical protein